MPRQMPRLILVRHGETEWSKAGKQTGSTDIPLTHNGEEQVKKTALRLVGDGLVIEPNNLCTVQVSPRLRAYKTFQLLFQHTGSTPSYTINEEVREWDFGDYEGMKSQDVGEIKPDWSIWKDGCPGGETTEQMQDRVDNVIKQVREYHQAYKGGEPNVQRDFMIVAHGVFIRVFIARWIGSPLSLGSHFIIEAGSIAILGYKHDSLSEPAIHALNLAALPRE